MSDRLITARAGEALCLLGNEAIVRGAVEAGVRLVSGYPGTPASEIGDCFAVIAGEAGVHFEWSVNEKVALEVAFGAAVLGARSLCHMKHLGLAAAGDPLGTIPYVGVVGGMVVVSAGDPGMVVSPNEQDQRHLARMHMIPVLEPATPAQAHAYTRLAFGLSEESGLPVILRTTPAVAHCRGLVVLGEVSPGAPTPAFRRRPSELTPIPVNARRMRVELDGRLERVEELLASAPLYECTGSGRDGVLVAGAPLPMVLDWVEELGLGGRVLVQSLGATYPLPRGLLEGFLGRVDRVLVVEELTPFVEDQVRSLAYELRPEVEVLGKRTGHLPGRFAYGSDLIADALAAYVGVVRERPAAGAVADLPPRPPVLCPGCAHRATYLAVRTVFGDQGLYFNDIGCYTLGYGPPLRSVDALLAMGSSIAMASATSRVLGRKALAFVGDSTFFHSGMPALLNAVQAHDDVVVVVLDNRVTAMTGHQPSPTTPQPGEAGASPEAVARALGVTAVSVVDPHDLNGTVSALMEARRERGPAVVVARRDCAVMSFRERGPKPVRRRFAVDPTRCRHCGHESAGLHCGQGPQGEHERVMVLRRLLDQGTVPAPTPVGPEPPCSAACPANVCVQGYVGRVAAGRYAEALAGIRRRNPLPVVSSRVCHRPCEKVCTRAPADRPLAVNDLKRFLVDWEMADPSRAPAVEVGEATGKRVAVVGAGPSGLACARELKVRGHGVVLLDEHPTPGGMLVQGIPSHRLPREVVAYETEWILDHGVELRAGVRLGRDVTVSGLLANGFDAVYLGLGAMKGEPLGVNRDDLPGVVGALELLRRHHCGENLEVEGLRCVVVGGGDAAVDAARTLVRLGASAVTIAYRRSREEMPAHPEEVDAAVEEGVQLLTQRAPVRVNGGARVEGLELVATRPGPPDASGRRRRLPEFGSETVLAADLVVVAVGQRPNLGCVDVELAVTSDGSVVVDEATGATSVAGVFAGGDLTAGPKTVVHAIAAGRRAAYGIDRHLAADDATVAPLDAVDPTGLSFYTPVEVTVEPGWQASLRPATERRGDHDEVVVPLTEEQARQEASRCLLCGMCSACSACTDLFGCPALREEDGLMSIDQALCNGCGVCLAFCPNGAIHEVSAP